MSLSMPIQWYHSQVDPIWPDSTFKSILFVRVRMVFKIFYYPTGVILN
jgi:hypothetical protein